MMNLKKEIILVKALLLIAVIGSSCSAQPTKTEVTKVFTPTPLNNAYPAPSDLSTSSQPQSGYPGPEVNSQNTYVPVAPNNVPDPLEGKAAISGLLYSYPTNSPIMQIAFYLIPGIGPSQDIVPPVLGEPDAKKGDIISSSDKNGYISINNISPGNYFIVLWAPFDWILVDQSKTETKPLLLKLNPGDKINLGVLYASWP